MKVTFVGELNIHSIAEAFNNVFENMSKQDIDYMEEVYKEDCDLLLLDQYEKSKS